MLKHKNNSTTKSVVANLLHLVNIIPEFYVQLNHINTRRHSYDLNFKLKIVAEAVKNNREIAREYGISESMARKCRNQQDVLFSGFNTLIGILLRQ